MKDSFSGIIFIYPEYIIDVGWSNILKENIKIYTN